MDTVSSHPDLPSDSSPRSERIVDGIGVAPGIVIGAVHRYRSEAPEVGRETIAPREVESELSHFEEAVNRAEQEIKKVRSVAREKLGGQSEAIFQAQEMMLRDEELLEPVRQRIEEEHQSAGRALTDVLREHRQYLEASDDEYLRDRSSDFVELENRLLRGLQHGKMLATIEPSSIVVAETLSAADIIRFSRHGMLGCVTTQGGTTSHVSIIARALNIPAIVGAEGVMEVVEDHDRVILDGGQGRLVVNPSSETLEHYRQRRARQESVIQSQTQSSALPAETDDGRSVTLRANVEFGEELDVLEQFGAQGIGLMRTEMLFLMGPEASLSEEEQTEMYRKAARASGDDGATIRLLDLGGDKLLPLTRREENPFLGWRGIRVLLDRVDELLRPQLRALLRANAHGSLRILLPMVSHLDEVHRVRAILESEAEALSEQGIEHDPDLPIGVMVEVPSVALQIRAFAETADFLSIGTNDLTQYVLAVDRGNDLVADRFDALHPAVLGLIRRTVRVGKETNTPVVLCGELAGDVQALPVLLGLGLETLSISPTYIPIINRTIRQLKYSEAKGLAKDACAASDAETVRREVRNWMSQYVDVDLLPSSDVKD